MMLITQKSLWNFIPQVYLLYFWCQILPFGEFQLNLKSGGAPFHRRSFLMGIVCLYSVYLLRGHQNGCHVRVHPKLTFRPVVSLAGDSSVVTELQKQI